MLNSKNKRKENNCNQNIGNKTWGPVTDMAQDKAPEQHRAVR